MTEQTFVLFLLTLVLFSAEVLAQIQIGTIRGAVVDANGAAIPNLDVRLKTPSAAFKASLNLIKTTNSCLIICRFVQPALLAAANQKFTARKFRSGAGVIAVRGRNRRRRSY